MPKVNGFQVEEHGSGYQLTIRVHVGRDESYGGWVADLLGDLDVEDLVSRDTKGGGEDVNTNEPQAASGRGTRNRRNQQTDDAKRDTSSDNDNAHDEARAPDEGDADSGGEEDGKSSTRRRSRRAELESEAAETTAEVEKPKRGRRKPAEDKGGENPTESASAAKRKSRSRSTSATTATTAKSTRGRAQSADTKKAGKTGAASATKSRSKKKADKITDADLTKASSEAAGVVGAPAILDILDEFAVEKVGDLKDDQRAEFVERMKAEVENAD